ncbi:MAG: hypothetical protein AB1333_01035 [Patescibacteria group bacterium]
MKKFELGEEKKVESLKFWKHIESLGKSALLALLISFGVTETLDAQIQNAGQNKKENEKELVTKAYTINKRVYENLIKRNPIPFGIDGTSFENTDINETIYFQRGYTASSLEKRDGEKDIIYADNNGDGSVDRIILSEEKFETEAEKFSEFSNLAFIDEKFLDNDLSFSKLGGTMNKKIKVFEFKDINKSPRFIVYDFNVGEYGETDKEGVYDLWFKFQEKYVKSLENFSAEME